MPHYCIYLLTSHNRMPLYVGMTNDLERRLIEHHQGAQKPGKKTSFTAKYNCYYCIAYEPQPDFWTTKAREDELKGWRREKKLLWAESLNPGLPFLNDTILGEGWEERYRIGEKQ